MRFATGAIGGICFGSISRMLALLMRCLGRFDESDSYFRRALAAHRAAGAALLTAHTLRQHASLLGERGGPGDDAEAQEMSAEANETYRGLRLDHWTTSRSAASVGQGEGNAFRRDGEGWALSFDGRETRVRDVKGLAVIARLLAEPGREFPVLDLAAISRAEGLAVSGDSGAVSTRRPAAPISIGWVNSKPRSTTRPSTGTPKGELAPQPSAKPSSNS